MVEPSVRVESGPAPRANASTSTPSEPLSRLRPAERVVASWEPLVERIAAEYREMPGLSPTAAQAARLWGLDRDSCVAVLQALVADGWLRCTREHRYCVAGDLERVWRSAR